MLTRFAFCSLLLLSLPAAAFDRLVIFGTSLSDPGNAFVLLGSSSVPPDYSVDPFLVPDRPYARGGHHFSNGATWIEHLARARGLAANAQPALRPGSSRAANYAVGGARAHEGVASFSFSLQVARFLEDVSGAAPSSALYVVEIGANDLRDALAAFAAGGDPGAVIGAALQSIADNITALYLRGARQFLVWTVPNAGLTPALRSIPGGPQGATVLTALFNANLDAALAQLALALPGVQFSRFDVNAIFNSVLANPHAFGLTDATSACIRPNEPPFVCRRPDAFLFWDGIHPTAAAHGILARAAAAALP